MDDDKTHKISLFIHTHIAAAAGFYQFNSIPFHSIPLHYNLLLVITKIWRLGTGMQQQQKRSVHITRHIVVVNLNCFLLVNFLLYLGRQWALENENDHKCTHPVDIWAFGHSSLSLCQHRKQTFVGIYCNCIMPLKLKGDGHHNSSDVRVETEAWEACLGEYGSVVCKVMKGDRETNGKLWNFRVGEFGWPAL